MQYLWNKRLKNLNFVCLSFNLFHITYRNIKISAHVSPISHRFLQRFILFNSTFALSFSKSKKTQKFGIKDYTQLITHNLKSTKLANIDSAFFCSIFIPLS